MISNLAKLTKIPLRSIWNNEALDFTKWLAQEENLSLLSDEIGSDIKLIKTEASVGKFNVDMLAEEDITSRKIIIENQLEDSNHDHLGKLITYASGHDAEIIIWIVKDVREEHQKAVEWLNDHTYENINFFLIKIELWQIQDSNPAPKFEIIVSPNEWAKIIKSSQPNNKLTDTKLQQLEFWNGFKLYVQKIDQKIRLRTPRPQHWYDVSLGSSDAHISLTLNSKDNSLSCDLYISKNKALYDFLYSNKEVIDKEINENVKWWTAKKATGTRIKKSVSDVFDQQNYNECYSWLYEQITKSQKVFGKYIKEFKI